MVTAAVANASVIKHQRERWAGRVGRAPELAAAIAFASTRGSLVVVSAGNTAGGAVQPPANDPNVIAVGCVSLDENRCAFSASGDQVSVWAPGESVLTTRTTGTTATSLERA